VNKAEENNLRREHWSKLLLKLLNLDQSKQLHFSGSNQTEMCSVSRDTLTHLRLSKRASRCAGTKTAESNSQKQPFQMTFNVKM